MNPQARNWGLQPRVPRAALAGDDSPAGQGTGGRDGNGHWQPSSGEGR
jgi:hypothetical protein